MSNLDIIRAWKDEAYRLSLSDKERSLLPENPAGLIELDDADLGNVAGGGPTVQQNQSCYCVMGTDTPSFCKCVMGTDTPSFCFCTM